MNIADVKNLLFPCGWQRVHVLTVREKMKHLQTIVALTLVLTSSAKSEETKKPWVDLPAKYASELPECDRIEVFLLDGSVQDEGGDGTFPIRPYKQYSKIEKKKEIQGEDAKKLCNTWRSLTFDMWSQAMCHFPIYGLRFYQGDKLQFETSVCFGCSNFYFSRDGGETSWHGFRKKDDAGKTLIASLYEIIPRPEKPKESEQSGTGQPATRAQSKSKGGDKPQPKAEGRSQ